MPKETKKESLGCGKHVANIRCDKFSELCIRAQHAVRAKRTLICSPKNGLKLQPMELELLHRFPSIESEEDAHARADICGNIGAFESADGYTQEGVNNRARRNNKVQLLDGRKKVGCWSRG